MASAEQAALGSTFTTEKKRKQLSSEMNASCFVFNLRMVGGKSLKLWENKGAFTGAFENHVES